MGRPFDPPPFADTPRDELREMMRRAGGVALETISERILIEAVRANPLNLEAAGKEFRSLLVENPSESRLYVGFGPDQGTPDRADAVVPAGSWRLIPQRFEVASIGADPDLLGAAALEAYVTRYSRLLPAAAGGLGAFGTPSDPTAVVGNVGSGLPDSGAPVKVGGIARAAAAAAVDEGDRVDFQSDLRGSQKAILTDHTGVVTPSALSNLASDVVQTGFAALGRVAAAQLAFDGTFFQRIRAANVFKPLLNVAVVAGTPVVIWTPAAGKKFRLIGFALSLSVAGFLSLDDGTTVDVVRLPAMPAAEGIAAPELGNGLLSAAANNTLRVDVSANGNVNGLVWGTEE